MECEVGDYFSLDIVTLAVETHPHNFYRYIFQFNVKLSNRKSMCEKSYGVSLLARYLNVNSG